MKKLILLFICFGVLISIIITCAAVDTIALNQTIKDGIGDTIVSASENFEFGFFSLGTSKNRYVGIWYKKISDFTVVWVANTETPLTNTSGELKVSQDGLQLFNGNKTVIWSSNSSATVSLVAQLQDNGNLVLRDQGSLIWQSFDYPGDTLLPGMRIGVDLVTGKDRHLTSWKSKDDPSAGQHVLRVAPKGYPQLFQTRLGSRSRFGPWNGVTFNGMPDFGKNISIQFVFTETGRYYEYQLVNNLVLFRMHLEPDGKLENLNWINQTQSWSVFSSATIDDCANYSICGANGECNEYNAPACSCLEGFEPRRPDQWSITDWSSGCQLKEPVVCGYGDSFRNISGIQFPDTNHSWYNQSMTLAECEAACKRNCSCMAYANSDIRSGGSGCLLWFGDLMDIRADVAAQVLYIRMHAFEPTSQEHSSNNKKHTMVILVSTLLGSILVCLILALCLSWRKKKRLHNTILGPVPAHDDNYTNETNKEDTGLSSYSLSIIATSTNNFSPDNKLGEGGFGPVYKGVLDDGQEIAVKQLSKTSTQGLDEFKNEVKFIAKLQHRNLVKLLGYCIQGRERMLIYEYMANKSLDSFIFDPSQSSKLDWPRRFHIIHGISRGLLYLHHDSRLRIVHRDLKASNILLDKDWNPKISDFGLARRFSGHETEANTTRVVGTYGYIPPEYALHGQVSLKSDVYSFGVLMLEIVCGKKNRGFSQDEHHDTLIGHAWRLHKEGKSLELMCPSLEASCVESQVLRSIHIGLLCVQHHAEDRPTMSSVVLRLSNDNALPPPKQPAFFAGEEMPEVRSISSGPTLNSVGEITITHLQAR